MTGFIELSLFTKGDPVLVNLHNVLSVHRAVRAENGEYPTIVSLNGRIVVVREEVPEVLRRAGPLQNLMPFTDHDDGSTVWINLALIASVCVDDEARGEPTAIATDVLVLHVREPVDYIRKLVRGIQQ